MKPPVILSDEDVSYMDKLLFGPDGKLQVVPAKELASLPPTHLMIWGNKNGVYTYPTQELIDWLKERIAGRTAIEIGAGLGGVGRGVGITMTDSHIQTSPEMLAYYAAMRQVPISPPEDVLKFEANDAVDHFQPEVVVGCYITQKYLPGDENAPVIGSSVYGVDELTMLPKIKTYLNIGNYSVHHDKRIRKFPHTVYQFDWLFTRSTNPEQNEIVVWEGFH